MNHFSTAFDAALLGKTPTFSIERAAETTCATFREMLEANEDDDDLCAWLMASVPGEKYTVGGASEHAVVERIT